MYNRQKDIQQMKRYIIERKIYNRQKDMKLIKINKQIDYEQIIYRQNYIRQIKDRKIDIIIKYITLI